MSSKYAESYASSTNINGSKEITQLFNVMVAQQLLTKEKSRPVETRPFPSSNTYLLASKWVANYLFENGMSKTLQSANHETKGYIKQTGLPIPIASELKLRSENEIFHQLATTVQPKARPEKYNRSTTRVAIEGPAGRATVKITKRGADIRDSKENREKIRDERQKAHQKSRELPQEALPAKESPKPQSQDHHHYHKHHHHHHRNEQPSESQQTPVRNSPHHTHHHHYHESPKKQVYSPKQRKIQDDVSTISNSQYGEVKKREVKPESPKKNTKQISFKNRIQKMLIKSALAIESTFEYHQQFTDYVPAYAPVEPVAYSPPPPEPVPEPAPQSVEQPPQETAESSKESSSIPSVKDSESSSAAPSVSSNSDSGSAAPIPSSSSSDEEKKDDEEEEEDFEEEEEEEDFVEEEDEEQ